MNYPNAAENECGGGTIDGDYCLCTSTVVDSAVFTSLPTREDVLDQLKVGAFDPAMYDQYNLFQGPTDGVAAYKVSTENDYTKLTIFRVTEEHTGNFLYFKNVQSTVQVCGGTTFTFRNSPTFFDIVDPELVSAYQEMEGYIDYVHKHPSTPPFVCKSLMKHLGYSNPTPAAVFACSTAFKAGSFTFTNTDNSVLSYGVSGQRGNLAAVVSSIILSPDALSPTTDMDPAGGGIKSPLLKLFQVMRSFKLTRTLHHRRTDILFRPSVIGEAPYEIRK